MNSGHQTFFDAPVVVKYFGDRCKAVSRARGIRYNVHARFILLLIDSHYKDWGCIFWRSREDHFLGTTLKMLAASFSGEEDTCGFADKVSSMLAPWDVLWL